MAAQNAESLSVVDWRGTSFKVPSDITTNYRFFSLIGRGTYGQVFSAEHIQTGQLVAIKILDLLQQSEGVPATTLKEIALLKNLNHRSIVELLSISVGPQSFALVFEKCDTDIGILLEDLSRRGEILNRCLVRHLMFQVLEAIDYLHANNILHRDIKPQNMFVNLNVNKVPVTVKIGDFGLACTNGLSPVHELRNCGVVTLWYRAPELLFGHSNYSWKADVWSLGCLLVEMLSGSPLFSGRSENSQLRRICAVMSHVDWASVYKEITLSPALQLMVRSEEGMASFPEVIGALVGADELLRDLILRLLDINPDTRISVNEAFHHPYFQSIRDPSSNDRHHANIMCNVKEVDMNAVQGAQRFRDEIEQIVAASFASKKLAFQQQHPAPLNVPRETLNAHICAQRAAHVLSLHDD